MTSQKLDIFLTTNNKYFEKDQLPSIRKRLQDLGEDEWESVQVLQFNDPTISLIVSLIVGEFGVDRFLIGDIGLGVVKLLTCGGFGIWWIVDWFLIMPATRERNMDKLNEALR